ncbi:MAG: hypothetical protein OHK0024_01190 [Thalassobaculales bacterium]
MRGLTGSLATTAFMQAVTLVSGILAARLLLPEGRGELALILLWTGLVCSIFLFGLNDALTFRASQKDEAMPRLAATGFWLLLLHAATGIVAGAIAFPLLLGGRAELAVPALAVVPVYYLGLGAAMLLAGRRAVTAWNLLRAAPNLAYVAGVVTVAALGIARVESFVAAWILANLFGAVFGWWLLARRGWAGLRPDAGTARALWRYGATVQPGTLLTLATLHVDQIVLAQMSRPAELGIYVAGGALANALSVVGHTVIQFAQPRIAGAATPAEKAAVLGRYLRGLALLLLPAVVGLVLLAPLLVRLLFGEAFAASAEVTRALAVAAACATLKMLLHAGFKGFDRGLATGGVEIACLAVAVPLLAWLVPAHGALGAAAAMAVAQVAALLAALWQARRIGIDLGELLRPRLSELAALRALIRPPGQHQ